MIEVIGLAFVSWAIAEGFAPLQELKRVLQINGDYTWGTFADLLIKPLNCSLCFGFWLGVYSFWGQPYALTSASVVAILAEAISRIEKNTKSI